MTEKEEKYVTPTYVFVAPTPYGFDAKKFYEGDPGQVQLYKSHKSINQSIHFTYEEVRVGEETGPNYARVVPDGCAFIDFDDRKEAEIMKDIIVKSKVRCLMLKTMHGWHFLFRMPTFYEKESTKMINWWGFEFDTKGSWTDKDGKSMHAVQIIRACGMTRPEYASWEPDTPIAPEKINIESLDVLPYWLWGFDTKGSKLHKKGYFGDDKLEIEKKIRKGIPPKYTATTHPLIVLTKMREGSRHNYIVESCSYFGVVQGFTMNEFKTTIRIIHNYFLVKHGSPMPDSDLFGDLDKRWDEYLNNLRTNHWIFDPKTRVWTKVEQADSKIDERRGAEYLFKKFDFYGWGRNEDGTFKKLYYKAIDGPYDYQTDMTVPRAELRRHSEQNFKDIYFKEVEVQLMQLCAENGKVIRRNSEYIIVKNKALSCNLCQAYDFSWIGSRPPTDVVLPWNWQSEEWVNAHEKDLGRYIERFMKELSRNSKGVPQPEVERWLWVIAGASMVPANKLQKIVILAGGGQNGKSLYTSLIRLCLGENMYNESKIFDSNPQEKFWGEDLDKGILCVIDDLPRLYNREAFTYIKGAITGTDTVLINEKYKPKKRLDILPQIIACTNFDFELYDKTEGMKRRVKILPTEYHISDEDKDTDLEYKLVMNTLDMKIINDYKSSADGFNKEGARLMDMYTGEKAVLDSLDHGSLCWFANKARYEYFKALAIGFRLADSEGMKEKLDDTFAGGFDAEMDEFIRWYVEECSQSIWLRDLYSEYQDWHEETTAGEPAMRERAFMMRVNKAVDNLVEKCGYPVSVKKERNDKGIMLNKLIIVPGSIPEPPREKHNY